MKHFKAIFILAGLASVSQAAFADELRPIEAYSVHLGAVSGTVYYDVKGTDDRLVATLSSDGDATPVRIVTSLADGQSTILSVPRGPGESALEVTFVRHGGKVFTMDAETVVGSIR